MRSAACTNSSHYRAHTGAVGSCWGRGGLGAPLTGPAVKGGGCLSWSNQLSACLGITVPRELFICSPTQSLTHQFIHSFIHQLFIGYLPGPRYWGLDTQPDKNKPGFAFGRESPRPKKYPTNKQKVTAETRAGAGDLSGVMR